jgi:hypothetical protein
MKRYDDIIALIQESTGQYDEIKGSYEKSLRDKSLDIRIKVKNLIENLRSVLDYTAHDIYEVVCKSHRQKLNKPHPRNIYFPYGRNESDFRSSITKSLPDLKGLSGSVYSLIRNVQPFVSGNLWLCDLCDVNNENKHDRLTPQTREEIETYAVEGPQGSVSIISNNPNIRVTSRQDAVKIFGVQAQFTPEGIKTAPSNLKHRRTVWVSFVFEGTSINVLNLLKNAVPGVQDLVKSIYRELIN